MFNSQRRHLLALSAAVGPVGKGKAAHLAVARRTPQTLRSRTRTPSRTAVGG
jgi:hypothetical protein